MAKVTRIEIEGFRSIRDPIEIRMPQNIPVVLIGENNAGKSNIIRAIDILLGEWWPGSHQPENHEYWDRNPANGPIKIRASFTGMIGYGQIVDELIWEAHEDNNPSFKCLLEGNNERFVNKEMRDQCICFSISADRRLPYQLSYTSKFTLLAKLMRKFHTFLTADENRVNRLRDKFDEIRDVFDEVTEFGNFQEELRNQFGEMFGGMSYGLQVDFSAYDPSNFFHSLRMQAVEGDTIRTLEELGTGQEQLLALAFAHAYAKAFYGGIFLAIEEPEAHLHPLAQEWLAKKVREMCSDGLQLMLTTHSPAFIDILGLPGCILVRKIENATSVRQLNKEELTDYCRAHGSHPDRTNVETILPFYEGSATQSIKAGLFAKKIVLVEGMTESLALPIYLSKAGLDVTKEGIAIIPVMGKGNLGKWWRFFTAFEIPTYICFDNDIEDDERANKRKDVLNAINLDETEIEDAIANESWAVFNYYTVFGTNFERAMRTSFDGYERIEQDAREQLGESKPLIARFVATQLSRADEQVGWQRISEMVEALQNLSIEESTDEAQENYDLPF